nr:hypothetical protein [uncultured Carboxylicivirga sp.]
MKKAIFFITSSLIIGFTACNKNENLIPDQTIQNANLYVTTESVVTTDATIDDVVEATEYEAELYSSISETTASTYSTSSLKSNDNNPFRNRYKEGGYPHLNIDSENGTFPKTIILDYGESTVLNNGRVISGIIQIVISAPRTESGATRTITFDNFMVDSIAIDGEIIKTFELNNYTIHITRNLTITLPDGTVITIESERTKLWIEGMDTPLIHEDDVFEITGYSNIIDSDGDEFKKEISIPLIKTGTCRYIVSGEVTLSQNTIVFAVINYGDGTCDNIATYTTAEGTTEFNIGQRIREKRQQNRKN